MTIPGCHLGNGAAVEYNLDRTAFNLESRLILTLQPAEKSWLLLQSCIIYQYVHRYHINPGGRVEIRLVYCTTSIGCPHADGGCRIPCSIRGVSLQGYPFHGL